MSTWTISHPDTITYHIEIIKWIEQSKALPGIANLNERLGLQSTWFPACAFFSFTHAGAAYYVHLNAIVIVWVVLFIVTQINKCHIEKSPAAILWILLLSIHLWSYSQIRLTVTSTSPDFIAAIYIMFSIYFLYRQEKTQSEIIPVIIILFSFFSVCLKLSSTPVLIATIYLIIRLILWRKHKALFISLLISCILLSGFLFRNAISSGYVLFPSTFPNIVNKDWKLNEEVCKHVSAYIAAFAKTESHQSDEAINLANNMKIHEWMPVWWSLRSLADKIIIALSVLSLLAIVLQIKKIKQLSITNIVCILTPIVGSLFWFYLAPDPRFGFGFLLSLIGIAVHISSSKKKFILYSGRFLFSLLIILNISIGAYIVYRFNNYFSTRQIIYPIGVEAIPAQS